MEPASTSVADAVPVGLDAMQALASRRRFDVLRALRDRRRTVSELADRLDVAKGTVHRHVGKLVEAGFVDRIDDPDRQWVYYELTPDGRRLADADRPRIVLQLAAAVLCLAGAIGAGAYAATLGAGPATGAPRAPGTDPPPPPGLLEQPMTWVVVAVVLALVGLVALLRSRRI